jgi:hypothetical protein
MEAYKSVSFLPNRTKLQFGYIPHSPIPARPESNLRLPRCIELNGWTRGWRKCRTELLSRPPLFCRSPETLAVFPQGVSGLPILGPRRDALFAKKKQPGHDFS